ncbi:biotin carboxylase N-terminal domain-containing protein [Streptomyces massasporeus]|uniref:biotin carboxylase N-terminal domain-containing protein n=1 Tax=Streptomyces massasporeus TaxID=67324 RepID=UPI0033E9F66B
MGDPRSRELDLPTVALRSRDEADALHARMADEVVVLNGEGSGAFLDAAAMAGAVVRAGCAAVHPGHGLLAENAGFAQSCTGAGLTWVGPRPKVLRTLGDKTARKRIWPLRIFGGCRVNDSRSASSMPASRAAAAKARLRARCSSVSPTAAQVALRRSCAKNRPPRPDTFACIGSPQSVQASTGRGRTRYTASQAMPAPRPSTVASSVPCPDRRAVNGIDTLPSLIGRRHLSSLPAHQPRNRPARLRIDSTRHDPAAGGGRINIEFNPHSSVPLISVEDVRGSATAMAVPVDLPDGRA